MAGRKTTEAANTSAAALKQVLSSAACAEIQQGLSDRHAIRFTSIALALLAAAGLGATAALAAARLSGHLTP